MDRTWLWVNRTSLFETNEAVTSDDEVVNGTLGFGATVSTLTLVSIKDLGANKSPTVVTDDVAYLALAINDLDLDLIGLESLLEFHGYNVDVLLNKAADAFPLTALETKLNWSTFGANGTGYKGRTGLFEVMEMTDELRELVLSGASAMELRRKAIDEGMITLRASGLQKLREGSTSVEEVVRETVL